MTDQLNLFHYREVPNVGDWVLTEHGPGHVTEIAIPHEMHKRDPRRQYGETCYHTSPDGKTHHGSFSKAEPFVAVRYRSSTWSWFTTERLQPWEGEHKYNE